MTSEITPLLSNPAPNGLADCLPPISSTLERVQYIEIEELTFIDIYGAHDLSTPAAETAFVLIVLLQWRLNRMHQSVYSRDVWDYWSRERDKFRVIDGLEELILRRWKAFVADYRTTRDIEDVLWLKFPEREGNSRPVRVIDFLTNSDAPKALLSRRLIYLSLLRTWKYGLLVDEASLPSTKLAQFDAWCTPRVAHFIELVSRLAYLVLFAHFLVYPPARPILGGNPYEWRGFVLFFLAAASLGRPWSLSSIPFALILVALTSCLPSTPFPGDLAFSVLLFAFALHILQLILPHNPSPIFLLPPDFWLPIAALLSNCMSRIFLPVHLIFLPLLLVTWSLLYLSMRDTFFQVPVLHTLPSPMETRIALVALLAAEAVLLVLVVTLILVMGLSPSQRSGPSSNWDRYSERIGLDARKVFVRTVVRYAGPYYFPPPFNLFQLILRPPSTALRAYGASSAPLEKLERMLWRVIVGPISAVLAGLWAWGLRQ